MARKKNFRNPNGYGAVIKLGGKRRKPFGARVTVGWDASTGKQQFKYIGYFEKREGAMAALSDYNRGLISLDTNSATFLDVAERWFENKTKDMSDSSIRLYKASFANCERLFKYRIVDINADAIQQMIDENGKSKSTNIQIRSFCKQVFEYALANKLIVHNPVPYVKARGGEKREGERYSDATVEWLWKNRHLPYVDFFLILLYTGMRINEMLTVPLSVVNLEERHCIWGSKTESGKDRIIPFNHRIMPIIEEYTKNNRKYLIESNGRKVSYKKMNDMLKKYKVEMGATDTQVIHDFRRTFISLLSDADVALTTIQKIVGHKSVDVTSQVYIQKSLTALLTAVDKI